MTHEDKCPACIDRLLYESDRLAWSRKHAQGWVDRHKGLSAEAKREAWDNATPEMRQAIKEIT